jgi:hypothetical protein
MNILRMNIIALFIVFIAPLAAAADECLDCHRDKTPGIVAYWEESAHYAKDVGCTDCHGTDVKKSHDLQAPVVAETCGTCHKEALAQHLESKHSIGMKSGQGCTRNMTRTEERDQGCSLCHKPDTTEPFVDVECAMFLAQSPEMRRVGCVSCHKVETGCDTCHTKHGTDLAYAGKAETCGICHMGPDHAQLEMWRSSQHGVLFYERGEPAAPTCTTCHMDEGTHNVSRGIATGKPPEKALTERDIMVDICSRCHTPALSKRSLEDADRIHSQSLAILGEAQAIVTELYTEGLLEPSHGERPAHPLLGNEFVIGPHMLYEDISRAEATFFRMMMFYYMSSFKGAFHQSPDYSHWYGNAPLKLALSELKSEAALLRKTDSVSRRLDNIPPSTPKEEGSRGELKRRLRELKDRYLKGEITGEEYVSMKRAILEEWGL